jgi:hypothetical protein
VCGALDAIDFLRQHPKSKNGKSRSQQITKTLQALLLSHFAHGLVISLSLSLPRTLSSSYSLFLVLSRTLSLELSLFSLFSQVCSFLSSFVLDTCCVVHVECLCGCNSATNSYSRTLELSNSVFFVLSLSLSLVLSISSSSYISLVLSISSSSYISSCSLS